MSRRFATNLLVLFGALIVCIALAEGMVRVLHPQLGTISLNRELVQLSENEKLLYELRPNRSIRSEVTYATNEHGMRDRSRTRSRSRTREGAQGKVRIVTLGDSITFGYWVDQADVYTAKLESLVEANKLGEVGLEVLNFGVSGYNLDQEIETLRSKAMRFDPDIILFGLCLNDIDSPFSYEYGLTAGATERQGQAGPSEKLQTWLRSNSRLAAWIHYRRVEYDARKQWAEAREWQIGNGSDNLRLQLRQVLVPRMQEIAQIAAGRDVVVMLFPSFDVVDGNYKNDWFHEEVGGTARSAGLHYLDLRDDFHHLPPEETSVDVVHPSPWGHLIAAHRLALFLQETGLASKHGLRYQIDDDVLTVERARLVNVTGY